MIKTGIFLLILVLSYSYGIPCSAEEPVDDSEQERLEREGESEREMWEQERVRMKRWEIKQYFQRAMEHFKLARKAAEDAEAAAKACNGLKFQEAVKEARRQLALGSKDLRKADNLEKELLGGLGGMGGSYSVMGAAVRLAVEAILERAAEAMKKCVPSLWMPLSEGRLDLKVTGVGTTTGLACVLTNKTDTPMEIVIPTGTQLTTQAKGFQPYQTGYNHTIALGPGETVTKEIVAFCTDNSLKPAPKDDPSVTYTVPEGPPTPQQEKITELIVTTNQLRQFYSNIGPVAEPDDFLVAGGPPPVTVPTPLEVPKRLPYGPPDFIILQEPEPEVYEPPEKDPYDEEWEEPEVYGPPEKPEPEVYGPPEKDPYDEEWEPAPPPKPRTPEEEKLRERWKKELDEWMKKHWPPPPPEKPEEDEFAPLPLPPVEWWKYRLVPLPDWLVQGPEVLLVGDVWYYWFYGPDLPLDPRPRITMDFPEAWDKPYDPLAPEPGPFFPEPESFTDDPLDPRTFPPVGPEPDRIGGFGGISDPLEPFFGPPKLPPGMIVLPPGRILLSLSGPLEFPGTTQFTLAEVPELKTNISSRKEKGEAVFSNPTGKVEVSLAPTEDPEIVKFNITKLEARSPSFKALGESRGDINIALNSPEKSTGTLNMKTGEVRGTVSVKASGKEYKEPFPAAAYYTGRFDIPTKKLSLNLRRGISFEPVEIPQGPYEKANPEKFWESVQLYTIWRETNKIGKNELSKLMEEQFREKYPVQKARKLGEQVAEEIIGRVDKVYESHKELKEEGIDFSTLDPTLKLRKT